MRCEEGVNGQGKGLRNREAEKPDPDGIVSSPGSSCA